MQASFLNFKPYTVMMKRILSLAAALLLSSGALMAQESTQPQSLPIGMPLPHPGLKFVSTKGDSVSLGAMQQQNGLLVMFSCNTCPWVVKSQALTRDMIAYARTNKLGVVIVNSNEGQRDDADSYKAMQAYARHQKYGAVPYIVDPGPLETAFGATRTPEVFLFNNQGRLVYKGGMTSNIEAPASEQKLFLKQAIDAMLSGTTIDPNTTRSVGCTIKRKS